MSLPLPLPFLPPTTSHLILPHLHSIPFIVPKLHLKQRRGVVVFPSPTKPWWRWSTTSGRLILSSRFKSGKFSSTGHSSFSSLNVTIEIFSCFPGKLVLSWNISTFGVEEEEAKEILMVLLVIASRWVGLESWEADDSWIGLWVVGSIPRFISFLRICVFQ